MRNNMPEGATPLDDYSGLKVLWVQNCDQLNAVESENINQALKKYLGRRKYSFPDWFSVEHINLIHKEMFGKVWRWAGIYRTTGKSIGIEPYKVSIEMRRLQNDIAYWGNEFPFTLIEVVARVHHRLVWIHPYENGNGRHARLIGDMILYASGYSYPCWPVLSDQGNKRDQYLHALREADRHHFSFLEDYMVRLGVAKIE